MMILIRNIMLTAEAEGFVKVCMKCDEFLLVLHCEIPEK